MRVVVAVRRIGVVLGTVLGVGALVAGVPSSAAQLNPPAAVTAAVAAADAEPGNRVAVAVLDRQTGALYEAGDADGEFPSESVVKVLIAADLLATGQMSGETEQMALQMITQSDDDDADSLWGTVGGPAVVNWAESYFDVPNLGEPPSQPGWWGNTKVTADGLVHLYAAIAANPVVGPWLTSAMSQMSATAADGTDQDFGLAAETSAGAFKQGWGDDDDTSDSTDLLSTGLLDGDRYAVAVLAQHMPGGTYAALLPAINGVAAAVAPGGHVIAPVVPPPTSPAPSTAPATTAPAKTAPSSAPASPTPAAASGSLSPASSAPAAASAHGRSGHSRISAVADALPKPVRGAAAGATIALGLYLAGLVLIWAARRRRISARRRGGRAGPGG